MMLVLAKLKEKEKILTERIRALRQQSGRESVRELELRRTSIQRAIKEIESIEEGKSIFLSYSTSGGGKELAQITHTVAKEKGFKVLTGFDDRIFEYEDDVVRGITNQINAATFFISIWTRQFDAVNRSLGSIGHGRVTSELGGIPSAWLPLELGIAMSLQKPFRLMMHNSIMSDFYMKEQPFNFRPHITFSEAEFLQKITMCVDIFDKKYEDLIGRERDLA